jgi:hypothetical protein
MKPIPFNSQKDLPPVVFDTQTCRLANELKQLGMPWQPHVGCFVWDPDGHIEAESPFPHRIYFMLSLPRFIDIFGSVEAIAEKLVWLPTWHQARLLCQQLGCCASNWACPIAPWLIFGKAKRRRQPVMNYGKSMSC